MTPCCDQLHECSCLLLEKECTSLWPDRHVFHDFGQAKCTGLFFISLDLFDYTCVAHPRNVTLPLGLQRVHVSC